LRKDEGKDSRRNSPIRQQNHFIGSYNNGGRSTQGQFNLRDSTIYSNNQHIEEGHDKEHVEEEIEESIKEEIEASGRQNNKKEKETRVNIHKEND
jgi:hypothetical protein